MNANYPEIKLSHKLVSTLTKLERLNGMIIGNRGKSETPDPELELISKTLQSNALSTICLDSTSPTQLTHPILSYFSKQGEPIFSATNSSTANSTAPISKENLEIISQTKNALTSNFELSEAGILNLVSKLICEQTENKEDLLRKSSAVFVAHDGKRVFTTVSPFLVPRRFKELIDWASEELLNEESAKALIIGTFHLLMLQLHPFKTANHRAVCIITYHLLKDAGYTFIERSPFFERFIFNSESYQNSLKYGERSSFSDWSTAPLWLEFFLKTLLECGEEAAKGDKLLLDHAILSNTQKQIIETIKKHGALSREKVVLETGINISTVKYNLSLLAERGHLKREGGGRSTFYRAS